MIRGEIDFTNLKKVTDEFESKTKTLFNDENGQYTNIMALLRLSGDDMQAIFDTADSYLTEDDDDIFHELRSMFVLGFCIAYFATSEPIELESYH